MQEHIVVVQLVTFWTLSVILFLNLKHFRTELCLHPQGMGLHNWIRLIELVPIFTRGLTMSVEPSWVGSLPVWGDRASSINLAQLSVVDNVQNKPVMILMYHCHKLLYLIVIAFNILSPLLQQCLCGICLCSTKMYIAFVVIIFQHMLCIHIWLVMLVKPRKKCRSCVYISVQKQIQWQVRFDYVTLYYTVHIL
jgi:hypothetical protein